MQHPLLWWNPEKQASVCVCVKTKTCTKATTQRSNKNCNSHLCKTGSIYFLFWFCCALDSLLIFFLFQLVHNRFWLHHHLGVLVEIRGFSARHSKNWFFRLKIDQSAFWKLEKHGSALLWLRQFLSEIVKLWLISGLLIVKFQKIMQGVWAVKLTTKR